MGTQPDKVLSLMRKKGVLRPVDLERAGIPKAVLSRLVERGLATRTGRGLYVLSDASSVTEHHSLVEAAARVPKGVVCLLSALRFHGLTTQAPFEVWLTIPVKAWTPKVDAPPIRIVRASGLALTEGIEWHRIEGASVPIYSAPKTVADCFKYRSTVGLDVALEALGDYLRTRRRNLDELWRHAEICRVKAVMRPYVEALA